MNVLKQHQPLLHNARTGADVANRAQELKDWIASIDKTSLDRHQQEDCVDYVDQDSGNQVIADTVVTSSGGFELNRWLERKDGLALASRVQVENGQVNGYEVDALPDGTFRGYTFSGSVSGNISTSLMDAQAAERDWNLVYIFTTFGRGQ